MAKPTANRIAINTKRPSSQPPTSCRGSGARCSTALVFEALADLLDAVLGDELRPCIEIGRRDAAVDLQIKLHHRPETLEKRLLAERAGEVAAADRILLRRPEIETEGADLAGLAGLGHRLGQCWGEDVVGGERADHIAARLEQRDDAVDRVLRIGIDADILRSGVHLELLELASVLQRLDDGVERRR